MCYGPQQLKLHTFNDQRILRLLTPGLTLRNPHHRQRVHKLRRGFKLWSASFILDELEDEHDFHRDVRFSIVECALGHRLETGITMHQMSARATNASQTVVGWRGTHM